MGKMTLEEENSIQPGLLKNADSSQLRHQPVSETTEENPRDGLYEQLCLLYTMCHSLKASNLVA